MNPEEYIHNGTVTDYCLGLLKEEDRLEFEIAMELYPILKDELRKQEENIKAGRMGKAVLGRALKDKILGTLQNLELENNMELTNLPLLNKYSDPKKWLNMVGPLLPSALEGDMFAKVLTSTDKVTQMLIMTTADVPEEMHDDMRESFIILDGECDCRIGDKTIRMQAGDFLEIPLHINHDVILLSECVIAVMQRVSV